MGLRSSLALGGMAARCPGSESLWPLLIAVIKLIRVSCRWRKVQAATLLYCGCVRAAGAIPKSGEGVLDVQATALELYRERSSDHSDYKFLAVYQYVHTKPKFGALMEEVDRKGNRKGKRDTTKREGPTMSEGTDRSSLPTSLRL